MLVSSAGKGLLGRLCTFSFRRQFSSYPDNPFDLNSDNLLSDPQELKKFLENDPNLEGFFETDIIKEVENDNLADDSISDPFDFSELQNSHFDDSIQQEINLQQQQQQESSSFDLEKFNKFRNFYNHNELIPNDLHPIPNLDLPNLVKLNKPLIILSKFYDPRLNLSIEKYIYDNVPNITTGKDIQKTKSTIPKRLITYINHSAIVIGKNQNPYKEINLHLASILQIPILRRYSGGGTVVHDLGNVNFSFINDKNEFDRTNFSSTMIELLNEWINLENNELKLPKFELTTNSKGDIINSENLKKISGSAYQLSRGRSLHHGTMLLNSNLASLSNLLKLPIDYKNSIIDKSTDSIPSKVQNYNISTDVFLYACIEAFNNKIGSNNNNNNNNNDNIDPNHEKILQTDESIIIKLDNYNELPPQIWETYKELSSWSWTFAKTPKFSKKFVYNQDEFTFIINKGLIQQVILNDDIKNDILINLKSILENSSVPYKGDAIRQVVDPLDLQLSQYLSYNIDFNFNYNLSKFD